MVAIKRSRSRTDWEPLIAALRTELQEFGGLIRLLNDEQDAILINPSAATNARESIARQHSQAVMSARIRGGLMVVQGFEGAQRSATAPEIVREVPDEIRPLLDALFSEVEKLALRAGDCAYQNDWLRKRAPILAATMAGHGLESSNLQHPSSRE